MVRVQTYLVLAIILLLSLMTYNAIGVFSGFGSPTNASWFNTTWNYRIRLEINSTGPDREDWPIEYRINFSDRMPDTFDINSTRVFEYSSSGQLIKEVPSQFDIDGGFNASGNAIGTLVFIMDNMSQGNQTRIYYIYYDSVENGQKEAANYTTNITYAGNVSINVNISLMYFFIDTNRQENTSGLYMVKNIYETNVLYAEPTNRTAEYLEYNNGTDDLSFDLIGNYSFTEGPVRLTLTQIGDEIVFGNPGQKTSEGRIVKKYYFYDIGKDDITGTTTFIKIEQEFTNTAGYSIQRNSTVAGALAFDAERTLNADDYAFNLSDPYSWAKATKSAGGTGTVGIINVNETGTSNFYATNSSSLGRAGIHLDTTNIASNTSVSQKSVVFFGPSSSFAEDEFIKIRAGFSTPLNITEYEPERWYVDIVPFIEPVIYNRNETMLVRINLSIGDPYNLTYYANATLDMGTAGTGDDYTIQLYDNGNATYGDEVAGDMIFTNKFGINNTAVVGEWKINFTTYEEDFRLLNYTIGTFNVTNELNVTVNVLNPSGLVSRTVLAEVYVMNYMRSNWTPGAAVNCSQNGIDIVNITDLNNGTYSVNFTAPSSPGNFTLMCNATKTGNFGNSTDIFTTETVMTGVMVNITPANITLSNIELYVNESFIVDINASNIGYGTAYNSNITIELYQGWSSNPNSYNCNNISINGSCTTTFNITAPNGTVPGNYSANITVTWTNPNSTISTNMSVMNITVASNPGISVEESMISNWVGDGIESYVGNFTVLSIGNDELINITFNCSGGSVCQNFNLSFDPPNISSLATGDNQTVSVNVTVPMYYAPGTYNGTVNVSSNGISDVFLLEVNVSNQTRVGIALPVSNYTAYNVTLYANETFAFSTNITVFGLGSARNINITLETPALWPFVPSIGYCANMTMNENCLSQFNITIPNATQAGNYSMNATVTWTKPDNSTSTNMTSFNITVASNPVINLSVGNITSNLSTGNETTVGNFTVFSIGNDDLVNLTFNCSSGVVCQNFTVGFDPANISFLAMSDNQTVFVNVTTPTGYAAGTYNGTVNVSAIGASDELLLFITVLPTRIWNMTPTYCERSEYPDEGTVCDVSIENLGNAIINLTIIPESGNYTQVNVSNFTVGIGSNYTFSVTYNVTGAEQQIYNFTYLVQAVQSATPQEMNLTIRLLPYIPPIINITFSPDSNSTGQNETMGIIANITDQTGVGILWARFNVTRPNGTIDQFNMTLISQDGNVTEWRAVYPNQTGSTLQRGVYIVYIYSEDNVGNVGNRTANFTIYTKLVITSKTLSDQYYQGDTGLIYYSARNINGTGIEGVNVSFVIRNSTGYIFYTGSGQTNSYGTISPMPSFNIASDNPIGNYTLTADSVYYDSFVNLTIESEDNYSFGVQPRTVTVTGLFADIETAVVWYPDNIMKFGILVYDGEGKPVNATSINLTVIKPDGYTYFSTDIDLNSTIESTGFYTYQRSMDSGTPQGMFLAVLTVTKDQFQTMKMQAFRVSSGGPYDVRIELLENEVEPDGYLDFSMVVENMGDVSQDVDIVYWVSSENDTYYTFSEAVYTPAHANQSFTRSVYIYSYQPLGTYILNARVTYDIVQSPILVNASFAVVPAPPASTTSTTIGPGGVGGPSYGPPTAAVVEEYPRLQSGIMIERYDKEISLAQGMTRIRHVTIRNIGETVLDNVSLFILGIPLDWYDIKTPSFDKLYPDNSSIFIIDFHIPEDAGIGDYKINLLVMGGGESDQKSAILTIFESIEDVIRDEIRQLREDLQDLMLEVKVAEREGHDVSDINLIVDEIKNSINSAEENLDNNRTEDALKDIGDAKKRIDGVYDLLSKMKIITPSAVLPWNLIFIIIILVIIIIILVILWRKKKLKPVLRPYIKHVERLTGTIKKRGVATEELSAEKEKILRMLSILENEKNEGIVTERAYNEMKNSLENRLSKVDKTLKKNEPEIE